MPAILRLILCHCLLAPALLSGCGRPEPAVNAAADPANAASASDPAGERGNSPGSNAAAGDVVSGQEVMLTGSGLGVAMRGLHLGQHYEFGRPKAEVIAAATALRGPPTGSGRNDECGEGPIDHVDFGNLRLNFQQDRFVGWDAAPGDPPVRDEYGFGIGSPRTDIPEHDGQPPARIERTTLGIEFESSGFHGLLSSDRPDATVTDLWAGMVCAFR